MKILYVIAKYGADHSGNLIHRELGHEFQRHGHAFEVFAYASARERQGRGEQTVEENIPVYRAIAAGTTGTDLTNRLTKPLLQYDRFVTGTLALKRFLAKRPPYDVILVEGAYPFGGMFSFAAPATTKMIVTVAGGDFIDSRAANYGYGRFRVARALMGRAFRHSSAVRVTTELVRERAIQLGAQADQIALIPRNIASYCYAPNGLGLDTFRADARRALAEQYGWGQTRVIAAVGRLLPIKGFDMLVRALPETVRVAGDVKLLIAGPNREDPSVGDYQNYLSQLARERGVADYITFAGDVPHEQMRQLLAGVDVVAVPSILEGMNKIAVEAAAVGTPSVVTRTAGIADLLTSAGAGLVVAENSALALAEGLVSVLCDEGLRGRLGARGPGFAAQFSSERIAAQLIGLCERVISTQK